MYLISRPISQLKLLPAYPLTFGTLFNLLLLRGLSLSTTLLPEHLYSLVPSETVDGQPQLPSVSCGRGV